jgi:hypothetical protein
MHQHNFELVGGDTDGLAFKKADQSAFTKDERKTLLDELNSQMEGLIHWEDDGVFPCQLVIKTKNYALVDESGNLKIKGSALKATTKEKALKAFVEEIIKLLIDGSTELIRPTYFKYAREILNIKEISQWCSKKTITQAVLTNTRTNEARVRAALKGKPVQEGDKIYTFNKTETELCLVENFEGTYCRKTLLGKLYDTLCVFETVLDVKEFPNLTLKKNQGIIQELCMMNKTNLSDSVGSYLNTNAGTTFSTSQLSLTTSTT